MKDEEIIGLLKQKKFHPATKKLYAYYPVIKKFILKNNGSNQEAEDIFQDALIILINKVSAGSFELTSKLNTYLFSVSRLMWLEELRRKNKQLKWEDTAKTEFYESNDLSEDIARDEKTKRAQQAVQSLGEKCRQLLELFYYRNKSMKEIASSLGFASEKVAKNQKYRCIEKAKEFLKTN